MEKDVSVLNLFRKIICSLLCIYKNTLNTNLKNEAYKYLNEFLNQYELYNNEKKYTLNNCKEIIDFCNDCYEDVNVFDYAEDVEYGLKELMRITNKKGEN